MKQEIIIKISRVIPTAVTTVLENDITYSLILTLTCLTAYECPGLGYVNFRRIFDDFIL